MQFKTSLQFHIGQTKLEGWSKIGFNQATRLYCGVREGGIN